MTAHDIIESKLDKTSALAAEADVTNISDILNKYFGITHFCFIRFFHDGTHLLLSTNSDWVKCFYLNYFNRAPHHKKIDFYSSGYQLWESQADSAARIACRENFNIDHGITLIQRYTDCCEFFNFATTRSNYKIIDFYINNLDLLKNFSLYFKEKAAKLIQKANEDRAILPRCYVPNHCVDDSMKKNQLLCQQFIKKIRLNNGSQNGEFANLTLQEMACAKELIEGKTKKEIAKFLLISPRTVETHIEHMKEKLQCRTTTGLAAKLAVVMPQTASTNGILLSGN